MNFGKDFRDNPLNWSLPLGRAFGIRVRLHLLFILWILFQLARSMRDDMLAAWAVIIVLFFGVVLIHEFGHCFGARYVGGDADDILLWPLGGLATVQAPMTPRAQFITTAAGPMVNVIFCALTATALLLITGSTSSIPLNPLHPFGKLYASISMWSIAQWLSVLWGVNYIILLFNLLPTYPMDGGRLFQAIVWKYRGYRQATLLATFVGMIGAVVFGLIGLVSEQMILVCIAVFGYITCMQQRQMLKAGMLETESEWGYDFSKGYGGFEETSQKEQKPSWFARRRADKSAKQAQRRREREQALEREINDILDKVHRDGIHSLTAKEKKILESASKRQKSP